MKRCFFLMFLLGTLSVQAQKIKEKQKAEIISEAYTMFRLEVASWLATDRVIPALGDSKDRVGGYLSYVERDSIRTIFYAREKGNAILACVNFDGEASPGSLVADFNERAPFENEIDLIRIRAAVAKRVYEDESDFFRTFNDTGLNMVILPVKKGFKVYIMTAPQVDGLILFGNDYLLIYDQKGKFKQQERLHNSLIQMPTKSDDGQIVAGSVHSHVRGKSLFITPTDLCTLLLYSQFTDWEKHMVYSEKFISIWDIRKESLEIIPAKAMGKIRQDK